VDSQICLALDSAYYAAFDNVEPTGKRHYLGIDVSGSMVWSFIAGSHLSAREGAAAMAMVTVRTEPFTYAAAFCDKMLPLPLSKADSLADVVSRTSGLSFGGTDCALPMLDAMEKGIEADVFVILTDSETWCGRIHPVQALQQYRQKTGIPAKLIVVGLVSNGFSIADPSDAGMLDVVGMDASAPQVMAEFCRE
jgi:60 kDa SS-A/Ro ribonucleoprotein